MDNMKHNIILTRASQCIIEEDYCLGGRSNSPLIGFSKRDSYVDSCDNKVEVACCLEVASCEELRSSAC